MNIVENLKDEVLEKVSGGVDPETQADIDFLWSRIQQHSDELRQMEENGASPEAIQDKKNQINYFVAQVRALEQGIPFDAESYLNNLNIGKNNNLKPIRK